MNPRPLGYDPYDICLSRPKPSLTDAATSTDRTDPISLHRLRLSRLGLSRRVRFTNRFTKQAPDLHFLHLRHSLATRGCYESSRSVRSFGLAWIRALAAVHCDPAPADGVAAFVSRVAGPNRITSPGRSGTGSVQAGPTRLTGPPCTAPHGVELQPTPQPCTPMGRPIARWVMGCATPVSAGIERSLVTALTSADLQRKDDLLPMPLPRPHSLLHPAFTAPCPAVSRLDGPREKDRSHRHQRGSRWQV